MEGKICEKKLLCCLFIQLFVFQMRILTARVNALDDLWMEINGFTIDTTYFIPSVTLQILSFLLKNMDV